MSYGNILKLIENLLKNFKDINFIVSCGNNTEVLQKLKKLSNRRIIAIGFTEKLNKYMACSEVVLTKPGGLTTTEVSTMRKPFIHTMPIPGCENYNANFFYNKGMSLKSENIKETVTSLKLLLENKEKQEMLIENQKKYIDEKASDKIADFIIKELTKVDL